MNNSLRKYTTFNLIRLNLQICKISKIIFFSIPFFLFISYKVIEPLNEFSIKNNLNINIWDGFFKVITSPMLVLCIYFPFIVIITSIINIKVRRNKYIIIRIKNKFFKSISNLIANVLIGLLIAIIFFISAFLISYLFFGFDNNWSSTIKNIEVSIKFVDVLYLGNFVFSLTPIQATCVSFLEISIATVILISLKELLTNLISNIYVCDLIVSIYIFISMAIFMYNLQVGIFKMLNYITLNTISIINLHKFYNMDFYYISLRQSFITSLIFLSILLVINLIFSKKLEVKCD